MKSFKNLGFLFTLFALSFMVVSCEDDGTGGGGGSAGGDPVVDITASSATFTQEAGDTVFVNLTATAGDDFITCVEVLEDGARLSDISRVLWNNEVQSNPLCPNGQDGVEMVTYEIGIIVSDEIATTKIYNIVIRDAGARVITSGDITITTLGNPPTLTTTMMSGMVTTEPGTLQSYPLVGTPGTGDLATISVFENDVLMAADRLFFGPQQTENPFPLAADQLTGFDQSLQIRTSVEEGTNVYRIVLTDVDGLTAELEPQTIITEVQETPVTMIMGALFNSAGLAGTGGLDLDVDQGGTGSDDAEAEIRDLGNDGNGNWLMQIAPVNSSQIVRLIAGQNGLPEEFTFEFTTSVEQIPGVFANGVAYNSETVSEGDLFAVERDGVYYIIKIAQINDTTTGNGDNYVVDIIK